MHLPSGSRPSCCCCCCEMEEMDGVEGGTVSVLVQVLMENLSNSQDLKSGVQTEAQTLKGRFVMTSANILVVVYSCR
jgi:hypothetical protein